MPDTPFTHSPVHLCASTALEESGTGFGFDILDGGQPVRGFALRFEGKVLAYVNRCAHIPTELDWREGEFLDDQKQWIICSMHGAVYDPRDGLCVSGPCVNARLIHLDVREEDGQVHWYPSELYQPAFSSI